MQFLQIADSWFNLQQVESIEISRTATDATQELYTLVISLASGRVWSRRDIGKNELAQYAARIASATQS